MPHIEPKYYVYTSGFSLVTKCQRCMSVGLYQDAPPSSRCRYCGGRPVTQDEGRVWIKDKRRWLTFDEMMAAEEDERKKRIANKKESLFVSFFKFITGRGF